MGQHTSQVVSERGLRSVSPEHPEERISSCTAKMESQKQTTPHLDGASNARKHTRSDWRTKGRCVTRSESESTSRAKCDPGVAVRCVESLFRARLALGSPDELQCSILIWRYGRLQAMAHLPPPPSSPLRPLGCSQTNGLRNWQPKRSKI
jgi:hypothetical protein